jgi:hypothetical protein
MKLGGVCGELDLAHPGAGFAVLPQFCIKLSTICGLNKFRWLGQENGSMNVLHRFAFSPRKLVERFLNRISTQQKRGKN